MGQKSDKSRELLAKVEIFNSLDDNFLVRLENIMEPRNIFKGEDLAVHGGEALYFFILISGRIMLYAEDGKAVIFNSPGDFMGFDLLALNDRYRTGLKSLNQGEVLQFNRIGFLELIHEDPAMADIIMDAWETYLLKTAPFIGAPDSIGA